MRVGIANATITPERPIWLTGYASRTEPSDGKYNDLEASAVVFDNGQSRVGILAADLIGLDEFLLDPIRERAAELGIPPECMLVNCSHTHCGPAVRKLRSFLHTFDDEYLEGLKAAFAGLLERAVADLQEAALDYAVGSCTLGISRRRVPDGGGEAAMLPNPDKPVDTAVPVLRVASPEGAVRALLFSYACHPTTMGGYEIGTDYPGFARDWVAAAWPGCVPVFLQGCGGDVKPRYTKPNGRFGYVLLKPQDTVAEIGHELGRAVVAALAVPPQPVPAHLPAEPEAAAAAPIYLGGIVEKVRVPDKKRPKEKFHEIYVGAWRIGDVYVFGSQCELCSHVGLHIKRALPGYRLWTNGYTHWGGGYLPEAAAYPEGGYEVKCSTVSPATEGILIRNATRYIRALAAGNTGLGPIRVPPASPPPPP